MLGFGQFGGALDDAVFEAGLGRPQFLLRPFLRSDVGADAQDFSHIALRVERDLVGPGDPDPLAVAADVLVDVLFKRGRIPADLVHQ